MSANSLSLTTKATFIDEVHSHGKNAVLSAENFGQNHANLQGTVDAHSDAIDALSNKYYKNLEQQVKAIARVMASQNVNKLTETMKLVQDDLQRSLLHQITEKQKDIIARVEKEVGDVIEAKGALTQKIEKVEMHIMETVKTKFEEAYAMRRQNREEIDALKESMGEVPAIAEKNSKLLKTLDTRFSELKNEFRAFERQHEIANVEQDKATASLASEIRTALEAAKDKIAEETKGLNKTMQKRELLLDEEVKTIKHLIDRESTLRGDSLKNLQAYVSDEVFKLKNESDRRCGMLESHVDHKVSPFETSVREIRHLLEEEAVHRDTADKELSRRIAKEAQDRHHDEERLAAVIATCQSAVTKMHR